MNPEFRISVAPMVDWTDTWFRQFARIFTKKAWLYTEMITAPAILHGDLSRLLYYDSAEKPLVLQIAADSPEEAARAVNAAVPFAYDEINLNVGCPSDKVQKGRFGACLMAEPELVRDIITAMKSTSLVPVTIKHRIGIDDTGTYDHLKQFVQIVNEARPSRYIVHGRIALLKGLDPRQNRTIPPLRYEDVYRLKKDFPHITVDINGGIKTARDIESHVPFIDGVMIGREAYENPASMVWYDRLTGEEAPPPSLSYRQVIACIHKLDQRMRASGEPPWRLYRHLSGLFKNMRGAKEFRRFLDAKAFKDPAAAPTAETLYSLLPPQTLDTLLGET
ncbi:MAG: tRNA dihydrouridine(20/20a) synthase DusA [Spirochaetales bacterium]|nr:tRNA dihydrouridine(20/20a) synthase DusA [Spirochaetales bacterium]